MTKIKLCRWFKGFKSTRIIKIEAKHPAEALLIAVKEKGWKPYSILLDGTPLLLTKKLVKRIIQHYHKTLEKELSGLFVKINQTIRDSRG